MFSKILRSAKSALQPSAPATLQYPETDLFPPTPAPKTPARSDMVTTRTRAKAALENEAEVATPSAQIQASSRKRTREAVVTNPSGTSQKTAEPSSSSAKKRKITGTVTTTETHVEMPVTEVINLESSEEAESTEPALPAPKRQRSSGVKGEEKAKSQQKSMAQPRSPAKEPMSTISLISDDEEEEAPKPIASSQQVHSLLSDDEDEEVEQPKLSAENVESSTIKSKSPKINNSSRSTKAKAEAKEKPQSKEQKPAEEPAQLPGPKHRRFGSEEPVLEPPSSNSHERKEVDDSEEDSSDDEAPEEVGTREAAEEAKRTVRAAAKAVEDQKAAERKARKERDLALKKQAKSNKKRKRQSVKTDEGGDQDESEKATTSDIEPTDNIAMEDAPASNQPFAQKIDKFNLPDLLPLEYLEDEDEDDSAEFATLVTTESNQLKPKKTKFLDLVEKKPKDKKKGSTTFKVREKAQDARLAPKASKDAMSLKEAWLNGGVRKNGKKGSGSMRQPVKSGFFVNKKSGAGRR